MSTQLQQYRDLLKSLDPTQPLSQDQQSWYVPRPDGTATKLARSMQLEPKQSHLIVGSIGCGKSTELLAAGIILVGTPGIFTRYVEVSRLLDLESATTASLAIAIADELSKSLAKTFPDNEDLTDLRNRLEPLVNGGFDPYWDIFKNISELVSTLFDGADFVWLLDGLDRLSDSDDFDRIVMPLLQAFKAVGIGVALVGPRRMIASMERLGAGDVFDEIHWLGPLKPNEDTNNFHFLSQVLTSRDPTGFVPENIRDALIRWSGGLTRILLQLTRETIKETWICNVKQPDFPQLLAATDKVGRALLLGLADKELLLLKSLIKTGIFAPRMAADYALILTNRVLEYRGENALMTHEVHPTLHKFILSLPDPPSTKASTKA